MKNEENDHLPNEFSKIGIRLHLLRTYRKEKIATVANAIGVTHSVISKIENGRYASLKVGTLLQLAKHYDTSVEKII